MLNSLNNVFRRVGEALTPHRAALFLTNTEKVIGVSPEELGKEPPLLADYLYTLRSKTGSLARYKIART